MCWNATLQLAEAKSILELTMITRNHLPSILVALLFGFNAGDAAIGQSYPTKPIRFIVPFPAGGSTDVAARLIGEYLSRSLGQQVVVENKAGANGNIAVEAAAKSTPDGYTVLVATDSVVSNPHVYKTNIDVLKDLVPIIQFSQQPIVLAAHPRSASSRLPSW